MMTPTPQPLPRAQDEHKVSRRKLLVVDDDPGIRRLVGRLLGRDFEIDAANDGAEGLEKVRQQHFDLVLLDIAMPRMDGLTFLATATQLIPGMRVLMLTADSDIESVKSALDIGAQAYITKPFSAEDLRNVITHLLSPDQEGETAGDGHRPWRLAP